jgi:hypothetical protein
VAAAIARRFGDGDIFALAVHVQGDTLIRPCGPPAGLRARRGDGGRHDGRGLSDRHGRRERREERDATAMAA